MKSKNKIILEFVLFIALFSQTIIFPQNALNKFLFDRQINNNSGSAFKHYPIILKNPDKSANVYWKDYRNGFSEIFLQKYDTTFTKLENNKSTGLSIGENFKIKSINGSESILAYYKYEEKTVNLIKIDNENVNVLLSKELKLNDFSFISEFDLDIIDSNKIIIVWSGKKINDSRYNIYAIYLDFDLNETSTYFQPIKSFVGGNFNYPRISKINNNKFVVSYIQYLPPDNNLFTMIYDSTFVLQHDIKINEASIETDYSINTLNEYVDFIFKTGDGRILVQRIDTTGNKIGGNKSIVDRNSISNINISNYDETNHLLSWTEEKDLFYTLLDSNYSPRISPTKLTNSNENILNPSPKSIFNGKDYYMIWLQSSNQKFDLVFSQIDTLGNLLNNNIRINDDEGSGYHISPGIFAKGNNIYTYYNETDPFAFSGKIFQQNLFLSDDSVSEKTLISWDDRIALHPVYSNNNKKTVIAWNDFDRGNSNIQVFSRIINHDNQNSIFVDVSNSTIWDWRLNPYVSINGKGKIAYVWENPSLFNSIVCQLVDQFGALDGEQFIINDNLSNIRRSYPSCVLNNENILFVFWVQNNYELKMRKIDLNGNSFGNIITINDYIAPDNLIEITDADINLNTGKIVLTWTDYRNGDFDVYAQQIDNDGLPIGTNIKVNQEENGLKQGLPKVSINNKNEFVITWIEYKNEKSNIYAQIFLSDGTPWGENFIVAEDTTTSQLYPNVEFQADKIFFAWSSNSSHGKGVNVYINGFEWNSTVGVNDKNQLNLTKFHITEGYPNPFNMEINFKYSVPTNVKGNIEISIYNVIGEKVKTLVKKEAESGEYSIKWDGRNSKGNIMPSGIYLVKYSSGEKSLVRKVMLLK